MPGALPRAVTCTILPLSSTEPLAPSAVSLSSQGSPYSLLASWQEAMGEGYLLELSPVGHPVKNTLLLRGFTNFTYEGLSPGTLYAFEVSTLAGPYTSSPQRITNWTCECHSQPRAPHCLLPSPTVSCLRPCGGTGSPPASCRERAQQRGAAGCLWLCSASQAPMSRAQCPTCEGLGSKSTAQQLGDLGLFCLEKRRLGEGDLIAPCSSRRGGWSQAGIGLCS